jgi:hypothetical protein
MSLLDRLFGSSMAGVAGSLLSSARTVAWIRQHQQVTLPHVVSRLFLLEDAHRTLDANGLSTDDAIAVVDQLLDELPTDRNDDTTPPPYASVLDRICDRARAGGHTPMGAFVTELARELPRELGFVRAPLVASAPKLGKLFDVPLGHRGQELSLEGWHEGAKECLVIAQGLADTKWKVWMIGTAHVLFAILCWAPFADTLKAKGIDTVALIREIGATMPKPPWARRRPDGIKPGFSAGVLALIIRAERYAAEDAGDVRVRHLLAALHDERDLAPFVARLV